MALNSVVGDDEKAVVNGEVAPTEDVVQALIEILVDPRLPRRKIDSPSSRPSQEEHMSVAKQMHAVVLLYNYYHRKQNPQLQFVDFISFCSLAVKLRATMVSFMKWTNVCKSTEFNGTEDELSVTEKEIKDACDIAVGLDASADVPDKGGWPISKVAVLFIDSKRENCMLQFGAITEGVWSLLEKELDEPRINPEISSEKNSGEKRKRNSLKSVAADNDLLDLGYDVVKENTGIEHYQLKMVGSHIAYSLTKEKSAAQFYIIQGPVKFDESEEVPLKDLGESLLGPLVAKSFGSWSATDIVNYYHMLPYTGFISNLLSRNDLWWPSMHGDSAQSIISVRSLKNTPSKLSVSPVLDNNSGTIPAKIIDEFPLKNLFSDNEGHKKHRHSSRREVSKSAYKIQSMDIDKQATDEVSLKHNEPFSANRKSSNLERHINGLSRKTERDHNVSAPSKGQFQKTFVTSVINNEGKISPETPNKGREACHNASSVLPSRELEIFIDLRGTSQNDRGTREACHNASFVGPSKDLESGIDLPETFADNQCIDGKISGQSGEVGVSSGQSGSAKPVKQPCQLVTTTKLIIPIQDTPASEVLQNALVLLCNKRRQLFSEICSHEDMLAQYEHCIERIRDHGEVGLAEECTKSILSGDNCLMLKHGFEQIRTSSKIFVPGTSKCEDLENMCVQNNWRLPRYILEPSEGKFSAKVYLVSGRLELTSKGGLESNPTKARESAAAQMIADICERICENETN